MLTRNFPKKDQAVIATVWNTKKGRAEYKLLTYKKGKWYEGRKKCRALVLAYRALGAMPTQRQRSVFNVDSLDSVPEIGNGVYVTKGLYLSHTTPVEDFYVSDEYTEITTKNSVYIIK